MKLSRITTIGAIAVLLCACDDTPPSLAEQLVASWRGHSVEFTAHPSGALIGIEYYYPKANKVLYQQSEGKCLFGRFKVEGNEITYTYPNDTGATTTVEKRDGKLVTYFDSTNYHTNRIISNEPPQCNPENLEN